VVALKKGVETMLDSLPSELSRFVQHEIATGKYRSEEEVICQGLLLLQDRERRLEQLRRDVDRGIEQLENGDYTEYTDDSLRERFEQIKAEGRKRLARETGQ